MSKYIILLSAIILLGMGLFVPMPYEPKMWLSGMGTAFLYLSLAILFIERWIERRG